MSQATTPTPTIAGCILALGLVLLFPYAVQAQEGSIMTALNTDTSATALASGYVPTSAYVEPGADSNRTEFAFHSNAKTSATGGKGLTSHDFSRVLDTHTEELMACYMRGLKRDPELRGQVKFHFRIAPDGHVAMVKVAQSGLQTKRVEDCFIEKARTWSFPKNSAKGLTKFDTEVGFSMN